MKLGFKEVGLSSSGLNVDLKASSSAPAGKGVKTRKHSLRLFAAVHMFLNVRCHVCFRRFLFKY